MSHHPGTSAFGWPIEATLLGQQDGLAWFEVDHGETSTFTAFALQRGTVLATADLAVETNVTSVRVVTPVGLAVDGGGQVTMLGPDGEVVWFRTYSASRLIGGTDDILVLHQGKTLVLLDASTGRERGRRIPCGEHPHRSQISADGVAIRKGRGITFHTWEGERSHSLKTSHPAWFGRHGDRLVVVDRVDGTGRVRGAVARTVPPNTHTYVANDFATVTLWSTFIGFEALVERAEDTTTLVLRRSPHQSLVDERAILLCTGFEIVWITPSRIRVWEAPTWYTLVALVEGFPWVSDGTSMVLLGEATDWTHGRGISRTFEQLPLAMDPLALFARMPDRGRAPAALSQLIATWNAPEGRETLRAKGLRQVCPDGRPFFGCSHLPLFPLAEGDGHEVYLLLVQPESFPIGVVRWENEWMVTWFANSLEDFLTYGADGPPEPPMSPPGFDALVRPS